MRKVTIILAAVSDSPPLFPYGANFTGGHKMCFKFTIIFERFMWLGIVSFRFESFIEICGLQGFVGRNFTLLHTKLIFYIKYQPVICFSYSK